MAMPSISELLKFANLQMAAEAFLRVNKTEALITSGDQLVTALQRGNEHASKFVETEARKFAAEWEVVDQKANTSTGFSGTLFRYKGPTDPARGLTFGELVISLRSTEFIDDAARDNVATNTLEVKKTGWAWGQIADLQEWFQSLRADPDKLGSNTFSLTGYSLGGHLTTAFNLLNPGAAAKTVTFNGAGVGQMKSGFDLASAMALFTSLYPNPSTTPAAASAALQQQFGDATLWNYYTALRTALENGSLTPQAAVAKVRNDYPETQASGSRPLVVSELITALSEMESLRDLVTNYLPSLKAGGTGPDKDGSPVAVPLSDLAGYNLDYRMAVQIVARQSVAASTADQLRQAYGTKAILPMPADNAALFNQYDVVADTSPSAVSHSGWHYDDLNLRVFIEDQPLVRGGLLPDVAAASIAAGGVMLLVNEYAVKDFGDTHSLVLIVDSLNVQDTILQMLPVIGRKDAATTLHRILKGASNLLAANGDLLSGTGQGKAEGDVLENTVNALADVLLGAGNFTRLKGSPEGNTWAKTEDGGGYNGRNALFSLLEAIRNSPAYAKARSGAVVLELREAGTGMAAAAREDFSTFVALLGLSPFVVAPTTDTRSAWESALKMVWNGADVYNRWQSDTKPGAEAAGRSYTDAWLHDREAMLVRKLYYGNLNASYDSTQANAVGRAKSGDNNSTMQIANAYDHEDITWEDRSQKLLMRSGTTSATRYYRFGSDAAESDIQGAGRSDHLYGGAGNDTLNGLGGDDYLEGNADDDRLNGGEGADTLLGGNGADNLYGEAGNDLLVGGNGNDDLRGGEGFDTYRFQAGHGTDTITDSDRKGSIEFVTASGQMLVARTGARTADQPEGVYRSYSINAAGKVLYDAQFTYTVNGADLEVRAAGESGVITIKNFQDKDLGITLSEHAVAEATTGVIVGTTGNDQQARGTDGAGANLTGTSDDNEILGLGGADYMFGKAGRDRLYGDAGADTLYGGTEDDVLEGGLDADILVGEAGDDVLSGGEGNDELTGDLYRVGAEAGNDFLDGGADNDYMVAGGGRDILLGGAGNDFMDGDADTTPAAYHDADYLDGSTGNDTLIGSGGDDFLFGGTGIDELYGDAAVGVHGNDYLDGGADNDILYGYGADDTLLGGIGDDQLLGGTGSDTYLYWLGDGNDTLIDVYAADETNTLWLDGLDARQVKLSFYGEGYVLTMADGATLKLQGSYAYSIDSANGTYALQDVERSDIQSIAFGDGSEMDWNALLQRGFTQTSTEAGATVLGTNYDDTLSGAGNAALRGGKGSDTYQVAYDGITTVTDERRTGDVNVIQLDWGISARQIRATLDEGVLKLSWWAGGELRIAGVDANDVRGTLPIDRWEFADGSQLDVASLLARGLNLEGSSAADLLTGAQDVANQIRAGAGQDRLQGGALDDVLDGGADGDTYILTRGAGHDLVQDYDTMPGNTDMIELGADVLPQDVTVSRNLDHLTLTIHATDGSVDSTLTVQDWFAGEANRVERVVFADATVWDAAMLELLVAIPTAGNDNLFGTEGGDTLRSGLGDDALTGYAGDDFLEGGEGSDTYFISLGDGADEIVDASGYDTLVFRAGIASTALWFYTENGRDLMIEYGDDADDVVLVRDGMSGVIESVVIDGEGAWTVDQLWAIQRGLPAGSPTTAGVAALAHLGPWRLVESEGVSVPPDSTLRNPDGTDFTEVFYELGSDRADSLWHYVSYPVEPGDTVHVVLVGGKGNDTLGFDVDADLDPAPFTASFVFNVGDGADTLVGTSVIPRYVEFGSGITAQSLRLSESTRIGSYYNYQPFGGGYWASYRTHDLHIRYGDGDLLTIRDGASWGQVDGFRFADGTTYSLSELRRAQSGVVGGGEQAWQGTDGDDFYAGDASVGGRVSAPRDRVLYGLGGNDSLLAGGGDDELYGGADDDVLDGGEGNDLLDGGPGVNVYRQFRNSGHDVIRNFSTLVSGQDTIVFGPSIAPEDVLVRRYGKNLVLEVADADSSVTVLNWFEAGGARVDEVVFAGGQQWDSGELLSRLPMTAGSAALLSGSEGDDSLVGSAQDDFLRGHSGNDTLEGGAGADTLHGGAGSDVYVFNVGDGDDLIEDSVVLGGNTIRFGADVAFAQVQIRISEDGMSVLYDPDGYDSIRVAGVDPDNPLETAAVQRFEFADGSAYALSQMQVNFVKVGTAGDDEMPGTLFNDWLYGGDGGDTLYGGGGGDLFVGGSGNDFLAGAGGNDVYVFFVGDGQDVIAESDQSEGYADDADAITLGEGVSPDSVSVERSGEDLVLHYGDGDQITVRRWFEDRANAPRIERVEFAGSATVWDAAQLAAMAGGPQWEATHLDTPETYVEDTPLDLTAIEITADSSAYLTVTLTLSDPTVGALSSQGIGTVTADWDAQTGVWQAAGSAADLNAVLAQLQFTPRANFNGDFSIAASISDGAAPAITASKSFMGVAVNDAPVVVASLPSLQAVEMQPFSSLLPADAFADVDAEDTLSWSATLSDGAPLPSWLHFDADTRILSGTAPDSASGVWSLTVKASDPAGAAASASMVLDIANLLQGTAGADSLAGAALRDLLLGLGGNDSLNAADGNDTLVGGAGNDRLLGGNGNDVLTGDGAEDTGAVLTVSSLSILARGSVYGGVWPTMEVWIGGALVQSFTVNTAASAVYTVTAPLGMSTRDVHVVFTNDAYDPATGQDRNLWVDSITVNGRTVSARDAGTVLDYGSGAGARDGLNTTVSQGGLNTYGAIRIGLTADGDHLDGGTGADTMAGGWGNDLYYVDNAADVLAEQANAGHDIVRASVDWTLGSEFEDLELTGTAALNATGNDAGNTLRGNGAANRLDGGAGADMLVGGAGDDTYIVDNTGDSVYEAAGQGTDTVLASVSYAIANAEVEDLTLTGMAPINGTGNASTNLLIGNSASNVLTGNAGNDTLVGGAGNDRLLGGDGNDVLTGDGAEDTGAALTVSSLSILARGSVYGGVWPTMEVWIGGALVQSFTVNTAANAVYTVTAPLGMSTRDVHVVFTNDAYDPATGQDRNLWVDSITVNGRTVSARDAGTVLDYGSGAGARDGLNTTVSLGSLNTHGAIRIGLMADGDHLDGGTGADTMAGGWGNDLYYVDNAADVLAEQANAGHDIVRASVDWTLGSEFEDLELTGTAALNGTGNATSNTLRGNGAANRLDGGAGADILAGGAGNDWLQGAAGNDVLDGGVGDDTYAFGRGDGADVLADNDATAGNRDVLAFGLDIAAEQIWFARAGNHLEARVVGTNDRLSIQNWFLGGQYHVEQFQTSDGRTLLDSQVQGLVEAMAGFAPPAMGQSTLPAAYASQLQPVIAASWH